MNLTRTLRAYQEGGFFVAGLDTAGDTEVRDIPVADGPLVLVVGSEGRGLSRVVAAACDLLVRIPMASGTESLNAACGCVDRPVRDRHGAVSASMTSSRPV